MKVRGRIDRRGGGMEEEEEEEGDAGLPDIS